MTSSESEQVVAPVPDQPESIQKEKKKRVMSDKQKEAFEKARLKRLENIAKKKDLKELTQDVVQEKVETNGVKKARRKQNMDKVEEKLEVLKKVVKKPKKKAAAKVVVLSSSSESSSSGEEPMVYVKKKKAKPKPRKAKAPSPSESEDDYYEEPDPVQSYYAMFQQ